MNEFTFYSPTEIVFGKNAEDKTAELIIKNNGSRVLIVYGGGSVVKSGLLAKIEGQLGSANLICKTFGGVQPNPLLSYTQEGINEALDFGADFILAIGGGSVIDTAKAIAHGAKNQTTDIWKFWSREAVLTKSMPVGSILTISAAGSETSASSVLTNSETGEKRGLSTDLNRPRFAVMNPEFTYTLPKFQLACGITDIMMHTLDRYFTHDNTNEYTDEISEALLRVVVKNGRVAMTNPTDYLAASELMWCGSISHNGLTGLGHPVDFSVHQLGHELSGMFNVPHGASLSAVWDSWAKYCYAENPARFARYANKVWGIELSDTNASALTGISATADYFKSLGMPTSLSELGIGIQPDSVLQDLADRCVFRGKRLVGTFKPMNMTDVLAIYTTANR